MSGDRHCEDMMNRDSGKEGSALLLVMGFMLIGGILVGGALTYTLNNARITDRQYAMEQALHIAEGGVERAAQYIIDQDAYLFAQTVSGSGNLGYGEYDYLISKTGVRSYSIASTGIVNDVSRVVNIAKVYVATFAKFGWWSEVNGVIYFAGGDVLEGHIHTNDRVYMKTVDGDGPIFNGRLTSMEDKFQLLEVVGGSGSPSHESDPAVATTAGASFNEGFDMNNEQGSMASVPWDERKSLAQNPANPDGMYVEGLTYVEIDGNNMIINNAHQGLVDEVVPISSEQLLYVANAPGATSSSERGYVMMNGGTLDGQMTIFAENDIYIRDHLYYSNDPSDDHLPPAEQAQPGESDDKLGLISKDDVWISSAAPDNLNVHAGIMATGAISPFNDGKFGVLNYNSRPVSGDLMVYGSIVQQVRGAVGTSGAYGMVSGFTKDYWWDNRFGKSAPPHYPPLDEHIEIVGWSEEPGA